MKYFNRLAMGTCYYPEHWDESLWLNDLQRMLKAGIGTIRIAEFAWNKFENEEGVFTFDFFISFSFSFAFSFFFFQAEDGIRDARE